MSTGPDPRELEAIQLDVLTKIQRLTSEGQLTWSQDSLTRVHAEVTKQIKTAFILRPADALNADWSEFVIHVNDETLLFLNHPREGFAKRDSQSDHEKQLLKIASEIFDHVVTKPKRKKSFEALAQLENLSG